MGVKRFILIGTALISFICIEAQQAWSLQKCVETAKQNSIAIKQNELNIESAKNNTIATRHSRYPSFSGSTTFRSNFGRTIDPTTNDFNNQTISNNSWGINSGIPLFNGGSITNSIKQADINYQTSKLDAEQYAADLALTVVQYYLGIIYAQERLDNARIQAQTTTEQLNQVNKLIAAGNRPEGDRLDILAQQAKDEQNIISFTNTVNTNKLALKQLLRLPIDQAFEIERPAPDALQPSVHNENLSEIYKYALENRNDIKSGQLKIKSAEYGLKIDKASGLPTVNMGGSVGSVWSSQGQRLAGFKDVSNQTTVIFNGQSTTLTVINKVPYTESNPYTSQLNQNFNYGFGVQMNVPIYNNYRVRAQLKRDELNIENEKLKAEQIKETLKNNIQTVLNDLKAAQNTYEAARRSTEASRNAYNNTKIKFDLGSANTFELTSSKNKLDIAVTEELLSRFDYIFKSKVLDYYLGRPIQLN